MVTINIEKKHLWLITAVFVFVLGIGFVFGWTNPGDTADPIIHGHTGDEIEGGGDAQIEAGWYASCPSGWVNTGLVDRDSNDGPAVNEESDDQGGSQVVFCLKVSGGGSSGGGVDSPACTLCKTSCGGNWPSYQGKFATDDDGIANIVEMRGDSCAGAIQDRGSVGVRINLCCK
jgi:hypothetical protein